MARIAPRLTAREKTLIVLACLLFVAYFYYALAWAPLNQALGKAGADVVASRQRLEQLKTLSTTRQELETRVKALEADLKALVDRVPAAVDEPGLLRYIQAEAEVADLIAASVRMPEATADGDLVRVPVEVSARGLFPGVYAFVGSIEALPLVLRIESITVSAEEIEGQQPGRAGRVEMPVGERLVDMHLRFAIYTRPQGQAAPAGPPPGEPPAGLGRFDPFSGPQ